MSRFGKFIRRAHNKVVGQVERSAKQFGQFTQRAVRGVENYTHRLGRQIGGAEKQWIRNVEHGAQRGLVYSVKVSPYITAAAAFILELIPFFGQILALVWVALNYEVSRWTGYYAARVQGKSTQDSRNYGRTMQRRNLQSGLLGAGVGAIAAALGVTLVAAGEAATEGTALMAGEGGNVAINSADVGAQAADLSFEAEVAANVQNTISAGGEFVEGANYAAVALPTDFAQAEALGGSPGFFSNALSWVVSNPEKLVTAGYSIYQQVMKQLAPALAPQSVQFSMPGGGRVGGGDPGGPGPGSGLGGGISWDDVGEAAVSFFEEYGLWIAAALAVALVVLLTL